jgi:ABC-type transporter Mla subunit MlaD
MSDRPTKGLGSTRATAAAEPAAPDVDAATRRLMSALDALESAVERRRDADRDEDELASRIHALGTDRSRLADELDGALVKSRRLERTNREIAERLDTAIGTIRAVIDGKDEAGGQSQPVKDEPIVHDEEDEDVLASALNAEDEDEEEEE